MGRPAVILLSSALCLTVLVVLMYFSISWTIEVLQGTKQQVECNPDEFRCTSGECIDIFSMCNGTKECADGSDGTKTACEQLNVNPTSPPGSPLQSPPTPQSPTRGEGCLLPQSPEFGAYTSPACEVDNKSEVCSVNQQKLPWTPVPENWLLLFKCNKGYYIEETHDNNSYVFCIHGKWSPSIPVCKIPSSPYLGCYVDQEQRKLSGEFQESSSMTPQTCINFCREKGYLYAGVQNSSQCFCGDDRPKDSNKKPDSECSMKCAGDSDQNCGGDWRNSVFRSGFTGPRSMYLGCYADQESRNLKGDFKDFPNGLTPQLCMDHCKDRGFPFAGVQFSSQCFCGDKFPTVLDMRPQAECNMKCTGDQSQLCGGEWRHSVYMSGFTEALIFDSRYGYQGCYVDQDSRELTGHFQDLGDNNSPEGCIILCKEKGFTYAGLQNRTQCFCGNEEPKPDKRVDQQECKAKCPGDKRFNCGSDWRNNVYKTESDPLISDKRYEYVGCFKEEPRSLSGYNKYFNVSNFPATCIAFCKEKGYMYAGLQFRYQCFCGDEHPVQDKRVDQRDCKYRCTGDTRFICGGGYRNSIYKTGNADPLISDKRYEYVGCFVDQIEPRSLSGYYDNFNNSNSPATCIALCKEEGYMYAGLQYRYKCFCGDEHPVQDKRVDQRDCKYRCTGDTRFICGGRYRNSIYKTGNAALY